MNDKTLQILDDIYASTPLLKQINWTPRLMATLIRAKILTGYFDPTCKVWLTSRDHLNRILEIRKNVLITEGLESIDEDN